MGLHSAVPEGVDEFLAEFPAAHAVVDHSYRDAFRRLRNQKIPDFVSDPVVLDRVVFKVNVSSRPAKRRLDGGECLFAVEEHLRRISEREPGFCPFRKEERCLSFVFRKKVARVDSFSRCGELTSPVFSPHPLQFSEIFAFAKIRSEKKVDEKTDDGKQQEHQEPGDRSVRIFFFKEDNGCDKNTVCPEQAE